MMDQGMKKLQHKAGNFIDAVTFSDLEETPPQPV